MTELYEALKKANVDDATARAAATAVLAIESATNLATKADLAEMEARIIKWNLGAIAAVTTIFTVVVKWI